MATATAAPKRTAEPPKELATQVTAIQAQKFPKQIRSQKDYDAVSEFLKTVKQFRSRLAAFWDPEIKAAHALHKSLVGKFNQMDAPAKSAETMAKYLLSDFIQRKEAAEAEERRKKAEALAEQERARLAAQAAEAQAMGAPTEIVEAIQQQPLVIPEPEVKPKFERAEGQSSYDKWGAVCDDIQALIRHVAAHPEDSGLLMVNETALRKRGESQKELFNLPGCRVTKEKVIRSSMY